MYDNPLRLLLVDDDEDAFHLTRGILDQDPNCTYAIEWAPTYERGILSLATNPFDAALVDYRLGSERGLSFIENAVSVGCRVPLILVTDRDDPSLGLQALHHGATDFVVRNEFTPRELARVLQYAIERRRSDDERSRMRNELELLARNVSVGMWSVDLQLNLVSSWGGNIFPISDDVLPGPESAGTRLLFNPMIAEAHQRARTGHESEFDIRHARRTFRIRISPMRAADRSVSGSVGSAIEVTDSRYNSNQLSAAREIQRGFLPTSVPNVPGIDIAARCRPADAVGGDFYDFMSFSDGCLGVSIGDVCGHGFSSALVMVKTTSALRLMSKTETDPNRILRITNDFLTQDHPNRMNHLNKFVTVFFAKIDPRLRTLRYAAAGHNAHLLDEDGSCQTLSSTAMPLAINTDFDESNCSSVIPLTQGQILLLKTDGFHETLSPTNEPFLLERVLAVIRLHRHLPAAEILDHLFVEVDKYRGDRSQQDDMTAVIVKIT